MKAIRLVLLLPALLFVATTSTYAQGTETPKYHRQGFYAGIHTAAAVGESNFCSFGADKFRPGWNAGLNAGYRFTSIWSLEMSASWSQVSLAEQDCCLSHNYILGYDLNRYYDRSIIPEGMKGQYYKDIKSNVFVQRYGIQVNFNVLGLFNRTKRGPWGLDLSPAIYAAGSHASILLKETKAPMAKNTTTWHLGYGGQLFASYAVAKNMHVGFYGAYTQYMGRPIDGLPRVHSTNYTVDAGVKLILTFKSKKSSIPLEEDATTALLADVAHVSPADASENSSKEPLAQQEIAQAPSVQQEEAQKNLVQENSLQASDISESTPHTTVSTESTVAGQEEKAPSSPSRTTSQVAESQATAATVSHEEEYSLDTPYPIICFSFNSIWIESDQLAKIKEIAQALKANSSIRVRVVGWGDEIGGNKANKRVSLQRAEAVKKHLEQHSISSDRIEVVGAGIAPDNLTLGEGRIAIVQVIS